MSHDPRPRPLSPYLGVYRIQLHAALSILHRLTGLLLLVVPWLMLLWLWSVAAGEAQYQQVQAFWASRPGHITLLCLGYAGIYHLVNGLRHIAWDVGWLRLDVSHVRYSAWWLLGFMAIAVLLLGWLAQGRLA